MNYGLQAGELVLTLSEDAREAAWSAAGLPLKENAGADFWRLQMDDGIARDITLRSGSQFGGRVTLATDGEGLDVTYTELCEETGRKFQVDLTVHIRVSEGQFRFSSTILNNDEAHVNELKLPFIDLSCIGDKARERDVLYRSFGNGQRIADPWNSLDRAHSEYMYNDHHEIWLDMTYPSLASMAWFGVHSGGRFLYVGRHDDTFRTCTLAVGKGPRNEEPRLLLAVSHFPLLAAGERETTAVSVVSLEKGDWRKGSAIYRRWAESWFVEPVKPKWVQELRGWQRVILKHQYGEVFFTYADLPRLYLEGRKVGVEMLFLFGWWKGCFDNGYPVYEPDPQLGGEQGLRDAIAEVQRLGGRVALYTNGVLIDIKSDYYKETGYRICRKDIDGNEYREHYRFAGDGMLLRNNGYKSFVSACQSAPEWREQLLDVGRMKLGYAADCVFYDQIGGHWPHLCFDASHAHGNRGDRENQWKRDNLSAIRELCSGEQAFGTEFVVDCYAPYSDFHHSCQYASFKDEESFPELYRQTFPGTIMSNRFIHDERSDFRRQLNYAFVYGFRFDIAIYRCRKTIKDAPRYAEYVSELIGLRERYERFFYRGCFSLDTDLVLPDGIIKTEYVYGNERLLVLWNDSGEAKRLSLDPIDNAETELEAGKLLFRVV
ncbi:hypothetical protein GC098_16540 [Paenibacillus sp. LMG 31458]|uniref:DUF6259 domain-containing protein n=1 Tax=Paenibacillus phytorum TaxID=2654977 RepID=A0ABX1XWS7_9BACL|nr:DUF6259 domain-containing protein [Paenibacillus phytorum]NOU73008.1 hypothetical protein [Paenibacillus phytorum]